MLPVITQEPVVIQKTPASEWDETIDWTCASRGLGDDTIDTSAWAFTGDDDDLVLSDDSIAEDGLSTTIWLSAGTLGAFYAVTNTVVTSGGRTLTETFQVEMVANIFINQPRSI